MQAAGKSNASVREGRFDLDAAVGPEKPVWNAARFQNAHLLLERGQVALGARKLKDAESRLIVADVDRATQLAQAGQAVVGQTLHPVLVACEALRAAVREPRSHPTHEITVGA